MLSSSKIATLTGDPCEIVYLEKIRESLSSGGCSLLLSNAAWQNFLNARRNGHLMLALCYNKNVSFFGLQQSGLLRRHIYSVLDVREFEISSSRGGSGERLKLIKLRNPWGKKEWKGAWSNRWPHWPAHVKAQVVEVNASTQTGDGCFWMCFEDLVKYFYDITICKVRPNHHWFESRQSSLFYDFSSGTQVYSMNVLEAAAEDEEEVDFEMELFATGRKFADFDRNADPEIDLCMTLCRVDAASGEMECVAFIHEIEYFVSISRKLKAGSRYLIFATSFRAISRLIAEQANHANPNFFTYNLVVHGQANFSLDQTVVSAVKAADIFYSVAKAQGNVKRELENSMRTLTVTSNSIHFVFVENLSSCARIKLSLDLSQSKNLENTRNSNEIEDHVEPMTRHMIMYLTPKDYRKGFVIAYGLEFQIAQDCLVAEWNSVKRERNNMRQDFEPGILKFYSGLHCIRSIASSLGNFN